MFKLSPAQEAVPVQCALRPLPRPFLFKTDKQGEVTVLVQNHLKKVSLAPLCPLVAEALRVSKLQILPRGSSPSGARDPAYHSLPSSKIQINYTPTSSAPFPQPHKFIVTPGSMHQLQKEPMRSLLSCSQSSSKAKSPHE